MSQVPRDIITTDDGEIRIPNSNNIIAFDIRLSGIYNIVTEEIQNFYIASNSKQNRIIGVGIGRSLNNDLIATFEGNLHIVRCIAITDSNKKIWLANFKNYDQFNAKVGSNIDDIAEKFDSMNKDSIYGVVPKQTKIQSKNKLIIDNKGNTNKEKQIQAENRMPKKLEIKKLNKKIKKIKTSNQINQGGVPIDPPDTPTY